MNEFIWIAEQGDKYGFLIKLPKEIIVSQEIWNQINEYYDWYYEDKFGFRTIIFDNKNEECIYIKGIKLVIGQLTK